MCFQDIFFKTRWLQLCRARQPLALLCARSSKMILEALFLTALVMSSFYMCEVVSGAHGTSECVRGFHRTYDEYEESPPELGPEEDPTIETIFTITLSNDDDQQLAAGQDGWSTGGPRSFEFEDEVDDGEKETSLERSGKGPMRLHFRVAWRENPLFIESVL